MLELFLLAYFDAGVELARRVGRVSLDATERYSDSALLNFTIVLAPTENI